MPKTTGPLLLPIAVIIISLVVYKLYPFFKGASAPNHYNRKEGQEAFVVPELIPQDIANNLMETVFDMGQNGGK